uniref:Uncharacterized protein n=1 Tax=Anguilla anguilla TaxID=7936 RepID=A0A0E9SLN8_ANGAN
MVSSMARTELRHSRFAVVSVLLSGLSCRCMLEVEQASFCQIAIAFIAQTCQRRDNS